MAKKTKKNAEDPAAATAAHEPTLSDPHEQQDGQSTAVSAAADPAPSPKKKTAPRKSASKKSSAPDDEPAAASEPVETGPPVLSKKRSASKKKADRPELNAVGTPPLPVDADVPHHPASAEIGSGEAEAVAQAADAFEEAYEERIPTQRRPVALEAAPAASSIEIVSEDASAELVSPHAGSQPEASAHPAPATAGDGLEGGADHDGDDLAEEDTDEDIEDEDEEEDQELEAQDDDLDDEEDAEDDEDALDEEDDEDSEELAEDEEAGDQSSAPRPAPNLQRLQKILSQAGIASRRHAEELITEGRVQVNGQIVTELGSKADAARDHIRVDGKLLHGAERLRYFMLNKPRGYVTTVSDPEGRPTVMEFVAKQGERLYPVGRLDYLSEGLLLMTNDGDLANKLTRAAVGVEKVYLVKVSGQPTEEELERLRSGVSIAKGKPGEGRVHTSPAQIRQVRQGDNPWYEVVLVEGRNRELRKMFEEIGHFVEKIRRVGYGPLVLDVEPGQIRELEPGELDLLRRAADGKWKPKPRPQPRRTNEAGSPREGGFKKPAFKDSGKGTYTKGPGSKGAYAKGPGTKSSYQDRPPRREGGGFSRPAGSGADSGIVRREGRPQYGSDRPQRTSSDRPARFQDRGQSNFRGAKPDTQRAFRPTQDSGEAPRESRPARAQFGRSARPGDAGERRSSGPSSRGPRPGGTGGRSFPPREGAARGTGAGRDASRGFAGKRAPAAGGRTFRESGDRASSAGRTAERGGKPGADNRSSGFTPRPGRFDDNQDRRRTPASRPSSEDRRGSAPRDRRDDYPEPSARPNTERLHIEELGEQTPRAPRAERPESRGTRPPRTGGYTGRSGGQGSGRPQGSRSAPRTDRGENRGFGDRPRTGGDRPRTGGDRPRTGGDRPRSGSSSSGRPQGRPGFKGAGKSFGGPPRKSSGSRPPSTGRRPGASGGGRGNNRGPGNRGPSRGRS